MIEKLSLEQFKQFRKEMEQLVKRFIAEYEEKKDDKDFDADKHEQKLFDEYTLLQNSLLNYDLSEISFEAWNKFMIFSDKNHAVDFSKTKANIDFNLVEYYGNGNFKGCNVINLDKIWDELNPRDFDQKTVENNPTLFLSDIFSEEFKNKYYSLSLTIDDLSKLSQEQITELSEKKLIHLHMSDNKIYERLFYYVGLSKTVELYNNFNNDFNEINQLLSSKFYVKDGDKMKEQMINSEVKNIKNILYSTFRNEITNSRTNYKKINWPESFKNSNADLFLININVPEEVKERYLNRESTFRDLIEYSEIFNNIPIKNFVNENAYYYFITDHGKIKYNNAEFQKLFQKYPDVFIHLEEEDHLSKFYSFFGDGNTDKDLESVFIKAVKDYYRDNNSIPHTSEELPEWLSSINFKVVERLFGPDELLKYTDATIVRDSYQNKVIDTLGLENIKKFEQETGFFTHKHPSGDVLSYFNLFVSYFSNKYMFKNELVISNFKNGRLSYEEFLPQIAICFANMRKNGAVNSWNNYDFIQGKFREDYSEIFMDINAPEELRDAFYKNRITPGFLSLHKEYIPFLLNKNLSDTISTNIKLAIPSETYSKDNDSLDFIKLYSSRYGNEKCLHLLSKYGDIISNLTLTSFHNEINNVESIETLLRNAIYNKIINEKIDYRYLVNVPEFVSEYPEMFINSQTNIPKDIIEKFYSRYLSIYDFNSNPELIDLFENTNIIYGFGKDMSWAINIYEDSNKKVANYSKLKVVSIYNSIKNDNLQSAFKASIVNDWKNININDVDEIACLMNNITNFEFIKQYLSSIDEEKRNIIIDEFLRIISYSNCDFVIDLFSDNKISSYEDALKIISVCYNLREIDVIKNILTQNDSVIETTYINNMYDIINRLSLSNSSEMSRFKTELASQILSSDNPIEILNKIEDIFIKNNLPTVGKTYSCFETLHPDFKGFNFNYSMVSPVLKNTSLMGKKFIVFSDLIKASFGSNNRSVNEYLKNIKIGTVLYNKIKIGQIEYDKLSEIEKNELIVFSKHLATLYNNTRKGKKNEEIFISSGDIVQDIFELTKRLSPDGTLNYKLEDRIIRMFCGFAGIDTLEEAKNYVRAKVQNADNRNREAGLSDMVLEKGDFIKGIGDIKYLGNILQNGSVSKEYLGASADSDATPLDTDVSMIMDSDGTINEKIKQTAANGYGPIWFVLKNDDRFITTRDNSGELDVKRDMSKLEVFHTGVWGEGHYGIRTGFASGDINYIVMENYDPRVGLEIVMNGFYIPVANKDGKIIFTPKDYDELKTKMNGLSYYDMGKYILDDSIYVESKDINDILSSMEENKMETKYKSNLIKNRIENALSELGLKLKDKVELNNGSATLFNTGSTGRFTNLPGDGDFDYIMQIDNNIYLSPDKMNELRNKLIKMLSNNEKVPYDIVEGDIRELKTTVKDENGNEYPVEIDITFSHKTDKTEYASDVCVSDRLNNINSEEERNLVKANIIFAKKFLKSISAYKPARKFPEQGGLGGIGVENWILQNGGSFYSAAKSFVDAANNCSSFNDFKNVYSIPNFGFNHMAIKKNFYPHDNYIENMNEIGYNKMKQALNDYIDNYEYNQSVNKSGVK